MAKEELLGEVKKLISIGKEKGYLTYDELNNTLPAEMVSSEQIGTLMSMFGEMDIEIVDSADGDREQKLGESEEPAEEVEEVEGVEGKEEIEEEEKEIDLTPGVLSRTDDPVRLYLKEMGSVALLSREGEIEIAKRIEEGKNEIASVVFGMPMTIQFVLALREDLKTARSACARLCLSRRKSSKRMLRWWSETTKSCVKKRSKPWPRYVTPPKR